MGNLGSLVVDVKANTTMLENGLKSADAALKGFEKKLQAIGAGMVFRELLKGFKEIVAHSEEAQKAVDEMGVAWDGVLKQFGPGAAMIANGLGSVAKAVDKVINGFKMLAGAAGSVAGGGNMQDFIADWSKDQAASKGIDFGGKAMTSTDSASLDDIVGGALRKKPEKHGLDFGGEGVAPGDDITSIMDDAFNNNADAILKGIPDAIAKSSKTFEQVKAEHDTAMGASTEASHQAGLAASSGEGFLNSPEVQAIAVAGAVWDGLATTGEAMGTAIMGVTSQLGDFGKVAGGLAEMFTNPDANPMAILGQIVATIASHAKSFGKLMFVAGKIMESLGKVLEPFIEALIPVLDLINQLVPILNLGLKPGIEAMGAVMKAIVKVIATIVNAVLELIAKAVGIFSDDAARKIRKKKIHLGKSEEGYEDPDAVQFDNSLGNTTNYIDDLGDSAADAAQASKDYAAGLTNVPKGFKYALAAYGAAQGDSMGAAVAPPVHVENLTVNASTIKEVMKELMVMRMRQSFQNTGRTGTLNGDQNFRPAGYGL